MTVPIVLYHKADHDGRCSGAIIRYARPEVQLVGVDYDEPPPWKYIPDGSTVFMVDFSFQPFDKMIYLHKKTNLIWIDHHLSAIDEAQRVDFNPKGIRKLGYSGCELTWSFMLPHQKLPRSVYMLGRYDVWDHRDSDVLNFQYGMLNQDTQPTNDELWHKLFNNDTSLISDIIDEGEVILKYQKTIDMKYASYASFEATVEEYRAVVLNQSRGSSMTFESIFDPRKHDVMVSFGIIGPNSVKVSIYSRSEKIDVSRIAKKFGGGGHRNASGWSVSDIHTFFQQVVPTKR